MAMSDHQIWTSSTPGAQVIQEEQNQEDQQGKEIGSDQQQDDSWLQLHIGIPSLSIGTPSSSSTTNSFSLLPQIVSRPNTPMFSSMPPLGFWSSSNSSMPVQRFPLLPPPSVRQQVTGVWLLLKAAQNQRREPCLPQIPKSYVRIKDGRLTVRLLMKYLAIKLGLDHESQVQVSCRGQPLLPALSLQHVRDNIWCLSKAVTFIPYFPSINHVMTLDYCTSS